MFAIYRKPFRFLSDLLVCKQLPGATMNGFRLTSTRSGSCVPRHREAAQLFLTFQRNLKKKEVDFIEWWIVLLASYAVNTISYINVCLASVLFKLHSPNLLKLCCMENLIK